MLATTQNSTKAQGATALVVGRFQLFTLAHEHLIRHALTSYGKVIIALGSAFHARTPKNPFTWVERKNMILASFSPAEQVRLSFVAARDYFDDQKWAKEIRRLVAEKVREGPEVVVVGHYKDVSSYYLSTCFGGWKVDSAPKFGDIDATTLRAMLFSGTDEFITLSAMEEMTSAGVRDFLHVWMQQPCYRALTEEFSHLTRERKKYGVGPFVAGDGIYTTNSSVLLIERKEHPGKGLLAIPGGFLEPSRRETTRQCAIREGVEETKLGVLAITLDLAYKSSAVFDHPDRSVRGNVISHAFHFHFDTDHNPEVEGGDDARKAMWILKSELAGLENRFFDDHFMVLDHFLGIIRE